MVQTNQLIKDIIDSIDRGIIASSIVEITPGNYQIFSCNTLWLTLNRTITIGSVDYIITDIMPNEWVKVSGASLPVLSEFDIYAPHFFYGTVLAQNEQMNLIPNSLNKLPMIWLHEITRERFETDETLIIDRESDCDLYFMTDADFTDWLTPQHNQYAIMPMRNLIDSFIDTARNSARVQDNLSYEIMDHAKFGTYLESKGHVKHIFMDKLSGSQLKISIPFLKDMTCSALCN